jgi:hypothetical protein
MRMIAIILAACFAGGPAVAQSWKEYTYPEYAFAVAFPSDPHIETTSYQAADGRWVEAHVYSVKQDGGVFKVTVADLSDGVADESAVIGHAIKTLSQTGEIKVDIPARVNRVFGRQLSIVGADGSRSSVAVFFIKQRLYQIEGIALPAGNDAGSDAIRFQQSLVFTGGESNRPSDAVREARRGCRGASQNTGDPSSVASADANEARCRRRAR